MPSFYHTSAYGWKSIGTAKYLLAWWDAFAIGVGTSLVATVIAAAVAILYHAKLQPSLATLWAFLRLYRTLGSIDMRAFHRSRDDYKKRRSAGTITAYIGTAESSLKIVSLSLITGVQFEEFGKEIRRLVEQDRPVDVEISLLDPRKAQLMEAIAPVYGQSAGAVSTHIKTAMENLLKVRDDLKGETRSRLRLYFHSTIPFASAILIDIESPVRGRIQIETKAYKTGLDKSWGFELGARGKHPLFHTLAEGYKELIKDSEQIASRRTFE